LRKPTNPLRGPLLVVWCILLSAFTAVLGAAPLKVLRTKMGSGPFWLLGVCLVAGSTAAGWYPLAALLVIQVLIIGTFAEFEERDFTLRQSAAFSVLLTTLIMCSSFYIWTAFVGKAWLAQLTALVNSYLDRAASLNITVLSEVKAAELVVQIPSALVIFVMLSLGLALIFERVISNWAGVFYRRREKLTEFTAPDVVVWMFIFSLLGSFAQMHRPGVEAISLNFLNVCAVIYFFQGLAVLGKYFETFKISFFWRLMWVMILVIQLPILMALIGLIDYWADFRKVFVKKATDLKKRGIQ
jgi:hypothetical protein